MNVDEYKDKSLTMVNCCFRLEIHWHSELKPRYKFQLANTAKN